MSCETEDSLVVAAGGRLSASVRVDEPAWVSLQPVAVAQSVLDALARSPHAPIGVAECDVALLNDAGVAELNSTWRGKDGPTNVLSFPSGEDFTSGEDCHLGSIVLAYGVMRKEAAQREIELADHTAHLILHGLLHLLGHDHLDEPDRVAMEGIEVQLLAGLGIADPYWIGSATLSQNGED